MATRRAVARRDSDVAIGSGGARGRKFAKGEVVFKRFKILKFIGEGTFSEPNGLAAALA